MALALLARGHEPIAYSRHLGEVARELRRATVLVLDDLEDLHRPPDLIHAQHHLEAMTALSRFPHTPAIYVCHGWLPPEEAPPRHPRIRRYVAVDELVRQRLVDECGLPETRVETCLNFVDLERFRPRSPLPAHPLHALAFSNYVDEENILPVLRQACAAAGIAFKAVGKKLENPNACPEELLPHFDVVFAKGRAALEAAAVGAAVVLCDVSGLGPLVTSDELARLRSFNFGVRLLRAPVTVDAVTRELERYDAADTAEVTRQLRREIGLKTAIKRLLGLYEDVVSEHHETPASKDQEARAFASYLRRGPLTADFFQAERQQMWTVMGHAQEAARGLREHLTDTQNKHARLEQKLAAATAEQQRLAASVDRAQRAADLRQKQLKQATQEAEQLRGELSWITRSATWRWRERFLRQRWFGAVYRALFTRKGPG